MRTREVIFLILIIAGGITFFYVQTGKIHLSFDWGEGIFYDFEEFVYEESQEIPPPYPPELQINNSHGDIEIQGTKEEKITISFIKKIWRKNEEDAKEVADQLQMAVNKDDRLIKITTNRDEFRRKNFETNFRISIPESMDIKVKNSYGLVRCMNVGKADIRNRHGKVVASGIKGDLILENSYEDIEVENVQSNCLIDSTHSDLNVDDVKGNVRIRHEYGKANLEDISQEVSIEGTHNEVYGQRLAGRVEIENSYEKIMLIEVGPTKIIGHYSPIEADGVRESLEIIDRYSHVKLSDIQGNLKIEGKNLKVVGRAIVGEKISVSSSYQNIELSEFSGKTTIFLKNGEVILTPSPLTHPIEVTGEYTNILFHWPQGGEYPFEAKDKGGDIKWKLPVELSYQEENKLSIIKAFTEKLENPSIFISTTYGTIRIEE